MVSLSPQRRVLPECTPCQMGALLDRGKGCLAFLQLAAYGIETTQNDTHRLLVDFMHTFTHHVIRILEDLLHFRNRGRRAVKTYVS